MIDKVVCHQEKTCFEKLKFRVANHISKMVTLKPKKRVELMLGFAGEPRVKRIFDLNYHNPDPERIKGVLRKRRIKAAIEAAERNKRKRQSRKKPRRVFGLQPDGDSASSSDEE